MIPILIPLLAHMNTVLTRLTAARASRLDFLDASILAVSPINSVQYGSISMSGTTTAATATIATVGAKAVLHILGMNRNSVASTVGAGDLRVTLTNPTTITALRGESGGITSVNFVVIDYK